MKKNILLNSIILTVILLVFLKIDFRFQETVYCCGDDHDYYMHAETIGVDFDLDYKNQLLGNESKRYNFNNKIAPTGFIGSGLLASPFVLLGHTLDKLVSSENNLSSDILNFRFLLYSLSSVFYLFATLYLTFEILKKLKFNFSKYEVLLIYFGSGVVYYAFERFSMTHVYEVFCCTLIIYLALNFYTSTNKDIYAFLLPIFIAVGLSVRWVNYFYFLLPIFTKLLIYKNTKSGNSLLKNKYFYISSLLSGFIFMLHTNVLYGTYTFNPQFVYRTGGNVSNFITRDGNIVNFFQTNIVNLFKILFSQEFGLFWFSPIIFIGLILGIYNLFLNSERTFFFNLLVIFSFIQIFLVVLLWRSTASSYGFRYLFSLIPISILLYYQFQSTNKNKVLSNYLIVFSIFATLSVLFFETTQGTQLALTETENTFGRTLKYTQPLYLEGYIKSFLEINSYLKIFTTSFLGAIVFKLILIFIDVESLFELLGNLGLPISNQDFVEYIYEVDLIGIDKFLIIFSICFLLSMQMSKKLLSR